MKLDEFKKKYQQITGIDKLKSTQNENLLDILHYLISGTSNCISSIDNVASDNEVTIMPKNECNLPGLKQNYERTYLNVGLKFEVSEPYITLTVNPQTKTTTTDSKSNTNQQKVDTKNDDYFNIYRHVTKQIMGEELNEEINRIKKIIYNG